MKPLLRLRVVFLGMLVLLCGTPTSASEVAVHGTVRWSGNPRRIPEKGRIEHRGACDPGAYPLVERHGRRLADVAVWLTPIAAHAPISTVSALSFDRTDVISISEYACVFHPRLVVVAPGASVIVTNSDPQPHWLLTEGATAPRRQFYHRGGATLTIPVPRADRIHLWSGLHRWMEAWVVAVATPWRGLTDAKGTFAFAHVPPGEYVLHVWHPWLGEQTEVVSVPQHQALKVHYRAPAVPIDPDLSLSLPQLHKEWKRPRGDRQYW